MNQQSALLKWVVAGPALIGFTAYLGSLLLAGTIISNYFKALAGVCFGLSSSVFVATIWLKREPFNWKGGLNPKARPIRYHLGMFLFTAAAIGLLAAGVQMLHTAVMAPR